MSQDVVNTAVRTELPAARVLDVTPEEYHKDPCPVPSLSASTAHVIVSESPLHAWTRHPKFGESDDADEDLEAEEEDTKAKVNGTIIHRLLLGKGAELVVVDADSWRTKIAKALKAEAKAAGKVPVLACKLEELQTAADHVRENLARAGYELTGGESEIPIEWYERGAAGPVTCRSMIDYGWIEHGKAIDLKTIRSANPEHIARTFVDRGYHIQDRAYVRALESLRPQLTGRIDFDFLFCEIKPPYAVVSVVPDGAIQEIGQLHWGRAVSLWERCLAKNDWPGYATSRITLEAPQYVIAKHLGREWAA